MTREPSQKKEEREFGRCKLCLRHDQLRNSHVLSEFLYEPTYQHFDPQDPKKKRMLQVPSDASVRLSYPQKGLRERLLCGACEQHLNRVGERYASGVLKTMDGTEIPSGERLAVVSGVDYAAFKLFLMAQLWRAGVASDPDWGTVKLGPHQERLRKMLAAAEPGEPHEYACSVTRIPASSGALARAVIPPATAKYGAHRLYEFTARGYSWMYVVSGHSRNLFEPELYLSEDGDLPIIADATGSIDLRASVMNRQLREQRKIREGGETRDE